MHGRPHCWSLCGSASTSSGAAGSASLRLARCRPARGEAGPPRLPPPRLARAVSGRAEAQPDGGHHPSPLRVFAGEHPLWLPVLEAKKGAHLVLAGGPPVPSPAGGLVGSLG
eukprot:TRINITY_DN18818_c0_g1_i1.p2 TRINITY_DN18818_c0_g1~~TRINITY_DN18818_c0_g1_i1.p2  ORF type:complete len:112 (+),score=4.21 TRINITY_DN18818_c0_g1_i1:109-444(+)